ncbi:hypothetical protein FS837_008588 [Tulasnella sp. UAMH 9824]|nr:hypothetical protein FS837_008588 [Tulasnella sp. UAMH 9824]
MKNYESTFDPLSFRPRSPPEILPTIGSDRDLITSLIAMGELKMKLEEYQEAEGLLQESVSTARRTRHRCLTNALYFLAYCFREQSKLNEAVLSWEESYRLYEQQAQPKLSKDVASTLVDMKSSQGDWDDALLWHDHIIAICRKEKEYLEVAGHLEQKGAILAERERYDEAALHFEAAMLTWMESGNFSSWQRREITEKLCGNPKTVMKWECRLHLLCDVRKLQRRHPQLVTASLKLSIPVGHAEL